jgi:hypothetical protein
MPPLLWIPGNNKGGYDNDNPITMQTKAMGKRQATVNQTFTGKDLDELLAKAFVEKALAQALGPTDVLEVEAVHDVQTAMWTVQVHDATRLPHMSLYQLN